MIPLFVSLFGVLVTSISTAAWFKISDAGKNFTDDITVQTGSSDITINSINAYKSTYNEIDASTTDYSSSHVVRYNVKGDMGSGNINQGPITDFDVPSEGVGYYLVGDETWATATMGMDAEASWKYSSGKRFADPAIGGTNMGILKQVYLKEKTEFKVRHHYFNLGVMAEDWLSADIDSNLETTAALTTSSGNIKVKDDQSGWYNIFLLTSGKISVYRLPDPLEPEPSPRINPSNKGRLPSRTTTAAYEAKPVTSVHVVEDGISVGAVIISIESIGFADGYNHELFQSFLTQEFGSRQSYAYEAGTAMPTAKGWSYLDSETKYLVCPTGSSGFTFYFPEWVEYCGYKIVGNSYYNWFGSKSDGKPGTSENDEPFYFRKNSGGGKDPWGYCEAITNRLYNEVVWKMSGRSDGATTHTWGTALTVTKTAVYHVYGGSNQTASGITSESVSRYYLYDTPTTPSLAGFAWKEGGWYTDSDLTDPLTTQFLVSDLEIFTEFKQEASFKLYAYKRKHDGTETVMGDYNGIVETGYTESHYNPVAAPSATGYDSWSGTWYKTRSGTPATYSDAYSSADIGDPNSATNLYTYLEESSGLMTVTKKYLSTNKSSVTSTGGSLDDIDYYCDTAFTIADLDDLTADDSKKLNVSADSRYEFVGYSTDTTVANVIEDATRTFTSTTTTLYALFAPIGPHTLYKYKSYYVYDGSSYTDFYSLDTTNLSAYQTVQTSSSATLYDTEELAVPSTSSAAYAYIDRSIYTDLNNLVSGIYKFVSAGWYVGSALSCDYGTPYVAAEPRADVYLYERMVCTLSDHEDVYVDTLGSQWTDAKAYMVAPNTGTIFGLSQNTFDGSGSYLSEFRMPTGDTSLTFLVFNGADASPQGGESQTGNIVMNAAQWSSKGSRNTLEIYSTKDGSNNKTWGWAGFYGKPTPDADGYYLVGNNAFTGLGANEWTLITGKLMDGSTSEIPEDIADDVVACITGLTLSYGMSFKILHYETSNGKVGEWIGNNLNTDIETSNIAANFGTDVEIKSGIAGTNFAIYLTDNHKIIIRDNETSTFLLFSDTPASHSDKAFRMGNGDHTNAASPANLAIYEQGIKITQEDIENDLSFIIRDRRGGALNWYTYLADGDHGYAGNAALIGKGVTSSSDVYGYEGFSTDQYAPDDLYGFKFTTPGYYKFYLNSDNKVSVAPLPGDYGEGYYIVPHNDEIDDTDYYTGGVKMKEITNGINLAVYTCYYVNSDNLSIFFRCYRSGVDDVHAVGPNHVYCSALATDATTTSLATMENGILAFDHEGAYNIYLFNNGGTITCSVTEFTKASFFTLNSINHELESQDQIKDARTGLALEIEFSTTNNNYNVEAIAEMIAEGSGASQYLAFTYAVITEGADDGYEGYDNCYEYMYDKHYIGQGNYSPTNLASGSHRMIILIDYKYATLSSLPNTPMSNDFYFLIKMRQVV